MKCIQQIGNNEIYKVGKKILNEMCIDDKYMTDKIYIDFLGHNRWDIQCILYMFTHFLSQPACGAALAAVYSGQVTISLKTFPKKWAVQVKSF